MPITFKKPTGGKLIKGRDHRLRYTMTWDDDTALNLTTDIAAIYVGFKSSDALDDDNFVMAFNSIDNADQFITVTAAEGKGILWIKKTDQDDIIPEVKYCAEVVVVLTDGTEWSFVTDYNVVFGAPVVRVTGYEV
jgi:hypothetical protein